MSHERVLPWRPMTRPPAHARPGPFRYIGRGPLRAPTKSVSHRGDGTSNSGSASLANQIDVAAASVIDRYKKAFHNERMPPFCWVAASASACVSIASHSHEFLELRAPATTT